MPVISFIHKQFLFLDDTKLFSVDIDGSITSQSMNFEMPNSFIGLKPIVETELNDDTGKANLVSPERPLIL